MKLKLFLFGIFTLLSLVAYQQYRDFAAIKSISSYESCAAAKESRIQESYPATCVTRLGTKFSYETFLETYMNQDYSYSIDFPADWRKEDHGQNVTFTKTSDSEDQGFEAILSVSDTGMTKNNASLKTFFSPDERTEVTLVDNVRALKIINDQTISVIFLDSSGRYMMIRLESPHLFQYASMFDQILSTFQIID